MIFNNLAKQQLSTVSVTILDTGSSQGKVENAVGRIATEAATYLPLD